MFIRSTLLATLFLTLPAPAAQAADPLVLVVQPINSLETTQASYGPLADYLSKRTGRPVVLKPVSNYMSFWGMARREDQFDLALDAAHMTSYRIAAHHDHVIAKVKSRVSYSVVTSDDSMIMDMDELMGKRIATLPSPGLGAIRLLNMYPNTSRQPVLVIVQNAEQAIARLRDGRADAAIIPSPLVGSFEGLSVVEVTEQVPAPAFSVSSKVPTQTANALRTVLLGMTEDEQGQAILKAARISGFEAATDQDYAGYHELLDGVWGYDPMISANQ